MGVIALQVVNEHGYVVARPGLEVAAAVGRASILASNMAMVAHAVCSDRFARRPPSEPTLATEVAHLCGAEGGFLLRRKLWALAMLLERVLEHRPHLAQHLEAVLRSIGPAVEAIILAVEPALAVRPDSYEVVAVGHVSLETLGVGRFAVLLALLAAEGLLIVGHRNKRALEVEVDREGRPQSLLEVLELENVLASLWHRHPLDSAAVDAAALWSMLLEPGSRPVAGEGVQAAKAVRFLAVRASTQEPSHAGHSDVVMTPLGAIEQYQHDLIGAILVADVSRL